MKPLICHVQTIQPFELNSTKRNHCQAEHLSRSFHLQTVTAMPSKGLRRASLSTNTKIDAFNIAPKPLKPLLGIGVVSKRHIYLSFIQLKQLYSLAFVID